jgi:paraquat-inducible protein B
MPDSSDIPEAVAAQKSRRTVQLVWLIPLIAALVGGWLAVKSVLDRGPVITISFKTAEGLEAGKTKVKFKDVEIGLVSKIEISKDLSKVVATAELVKGAARALVEDTQFWVVRPRISGGSVSGLGTLLSGSYIGIGLGKTTQARREFTGLEVPPVFATGEAGREFVLRSKDLGSLDFGAPVFFRRLQVGQITGYELDKDGKGVTLKVFVNAPYDQYVNPNTRFWHASGVDVSLDASGIKINTQSVVSILIGGLAFETPANSAVVPPAEPNAVFELFANRDGAMKNPDLEVMKIAMVFNETVRGLVAGAPLDFRGIEIGSVTAIKAALNDASRGINIVVEADLYPARLRARAVTARAELSAKERAAAVDGMISHGLRGQLRTGNLLTGQLYIALDFFPNAPKAKIDWTKNPPEFPSTPGSLEDLRATVASITKKLDKVDLDAISADLRKTLQSGTGLIQRLDNETAADLRDTLHSATKLMQRLDAEVVPDARGTLEDARRALSSADRMLASESPLQHDMREALREIARAAQAFRVLADYLEHHPESLIRGKKEDEK